MQKPTVDVAGTRRLPVLVVVTILVLAGLLGGWYWLERAGSSRTAPTTRDDGTTFYQALASLNSSVTNQSGGPWLIFSVMGIAAEEYYSPNVKGYVSFNNSAPVNGCQMALNGLTMFNGSIPVFDGTFNSGTAPFWQLAYYSSTSKEVLVGTDVMGAPQLFTPFALQSNCTNAWGDFELDPTYWTSQIYSNSSLPPNSPIAAQSVWNNVDTGYLDSHLPLVELFTSGPAMLAATQDLPNGRLGVDFVSCGLAGFTGYEGDWTAGYGMTYYSGANKNGSYPGGSGFNATANCYLGNTETVSGAVVGSYQLVLANATTSDGSSTTWVDTSTAVDFALANGGEYTDMWGLANWMTSWNLLNGSSEHASLAIPGCRAWVPTVSDCGATGSGWYAVILSDSGGWLNSYGALPGGGTGWSEPVTALVSHQQVVIVVPDSWNLTGDVLYLTSTVSSATVEGSLTL